MNVKRLVVILVSLNLLLIGAGAFLVVWNPGKSSSKNSKNSESWDSSSPGSSTFASSSFGTQEAADNSASTSTATASNPAQNSNASNASRVAATNLSTAQVQFNGEVGNGGSNSAISSVRQSSSEARQGSRAGSFAGNPSASLPARQTANASQVSQSIPTVKVPAALMEPDPALKMNSQQLQQLDNLYQNFVDAVGGVNQDPSDPAYRRRWISAQQQSDEQYEAMFGIDAFNSMQFQEMRRALSPPTPTQ